MPKPIGNERRRPCFGWGDVRIGIARRPSGRALKSADIGKSWQIGTLDNNGSRSSWRPVPRSGTRRPRRPRANGRSTVGSTIRLTELFVAGFRDQILAETIGRLTQAASRAASVLEALLGSESDQVRLRAALGVIDVMIRTREHGELAARVAELERRVAESRPDRS
jgi:hypothetical protein